MIYLRWVARVGIVATVLTAPVAAQQSPEPAGQPPVGQQPAAPSQPTAPVAGTVACPAPVPPATLPARSFTGTAGILLYQVPTSKVPDFETFLTYVRDALEKSTDPTVRKQAAGWRFYRDTNLGPNGDVVYVFILDPVVPCVDYGLGPIMSAAIPDTAKLNEIWKLYQSSVRASHLMNLVPPQSPTATGVPTSPVPPAAQTPAPGPTSTAPPTQQPVPLDANPTRPPQ